MAQVVGGKQVGGNRRCRRWQGVVHHWACEDVSLFQHGSPPGECVAGSLKSLADGSGKLARVVAWVGAVGPFNRSSLLSICLATGRAWATATASLSFALK